MLRADVSEHSVCYIVIGGVSSQEAECSETSSLKIHTPGNHTKERIQHSKHGESLKSRLMFVVFLQVLKTGKWEALSFEIN